MAIDLLLADKQNETNNSPKDLFAMEGLNPSFGNAETTNDKINWDLPNYPFVTNYPTPEESAQANKNLGEGIQGAVQNFANTPEEAANVIGKHLYNKFNFAPKTKAAEVGGDIGDLASFFIPSGVGSAVVKGLEYLPKIGEAVSLAKNALNAAPFTKGTLKAIGRFGQGSLFQKEKNPESTSMDVVQAGGINALLPPLLSSLTSTNPLLSTAAKLAIGGAIGHHFGGIPGMMEGAAMGIGIPKGAKELGVSAPPVSSEFLTEPPNALAKERFEAGNRLGTPLRPSEAFNSPGIARNEGMISRTETGGQAMASLGQARIGQQKNAINDLLDTIFDRTDESKNEISRLYSNANKWSLKPEVVEQFKQDPVINEAFNTVKSDPAYQRKLKDVSENNYAYLNQVKRALDDMTGKANRAGENVKAAEYTDAKNQLLSIMDSSVPDYKAAREQAQRSIIRSNIQKQMNKKPITGTNFFNKFLANDDNYKNLRDSLSNVPEAQSKLDDMKLSWEHLIGTPTPRTSAGASAASMSTAREEMSALWNQYKDMIGAPRDVQRATFIHDPKWWAKFDEVMKYNQANERRQALINLLSPYLSAGILETANIKKDKK